MVLRPTITTFPARLPALPRSSSLGSTRARGRRTIVRKSHHKRGPRITVLRRLRKQGLKIVARRKLRRRDLNNQRVLQRPDSNHRRNRARRCNATLRLNRRVRLSRLRNVIAVLLRHHNVIRVQLNRLLSAKAARRRKTKGRILRRTKKRRTSSRHHKVAEIVFANFGPVRTTDWLFSLRARAGRSR